MPAFKAHAKNPSVWCACNTPGRVPQRRGDPRGWRGKAHVRLIKQRVKRRTGRCELRQQPLWWRLWEMMGLFIAQKDFVQLLCTRDSLGYLTQYVTAVMPL
jgi:hypothetical protein